MRRRIRAHKYFSRARFGRLMGDFVVETSRFAEEKQPFLNLSWIYSHKADLFLVISDFDQRNSLISMMMMLTKRMFSLSLVPLRDNFKQVNFKTSKRVATKARAGFSVNAAAVRFSFLHLLFWIEFTKDSKVTPY